MTKFMVLLAFMVSSQAEVAWAQAANADLFGQKTTEFYEAMKKKDGPGMSALLADDFIYTSPTGDNSNKTSYVDALVKFLTVESYKFNPVLVHIYGDAAVAVYRVSLHAKAGAQAWNPDLTATDTWIKQGGTWKMAAHHVSPMVKR